MDWEGWATADRKAKAAARRVGVTVAASAVLPVAQVVRAAVRAAGR